MKDFNSKADIEEWIAASGGDLSELRWAVSVGRFAGQNQRLAAAWLAERDAVEREAEQKRQLGMVCTMHRRLCSQVKTSRSR